MKSLGFSVATFMAIALVSLSSALAAEADNKPCNQRDLMSTAACTIPYGANWGCEIYQPMNGYQVVSIGERGSNYFTFTLGKQGNEGNTEYCNGRLTKNWLDGWKITNVSIYRNSQVRMDYSMPGGNLLPPDPLPLKP